jgi:type IV pilus assembly protein PilW
MTQPFPHYSRGAGLVEIMVSVTIGLVICLGAITVYTGSSKTYTIHETSSRLEEAGRYAFSVLEPDIRMSGFWGLAKGASSVTGGSSQLTGTTNASATWGAAVSYCGLNFDVDLQTPLEGTNDAYLAGAVAGCLPKTAAMPSADTLTVRHATAAVSTLTGTNPLQICSSMVAAALVNTSAGCPVQLITTPTGTVSGGIYGLVVNTYYINKDSSTTTGLPTLYAQMLTNASSALPTIVNTEILPGVEDMQVQFGIDPTGTTGIASQYVDAQTAMGLSGGLAEPTAQVVAVRIWLLLRADTAEMGFVDNNTYQYADRSTGNGTVTTLTTANAGKAYAPADHYRRLLVSRTIMLRNATGT